MRRPLIAVGSLAAGALLVVSGATSSAPVADGGAVLPGNADDAASPRDEYTFRGQLTTEIGSFLSSHWPDDEEPLPGVQLKVVRARGTNTRTQDATTDSRGEFQFTVEFKRDRDGVLPGDKDIRFALKARFRNEDLKVRKGGWGKNNWFTVARVNGQDGEDFDLGTLRFGGDGPQDLGRDLPWEHAQLWWFYHKLAEDFRRNGVGLDPDKTLTVSYPQKNVFQGENESFQYAQSALHIGDDDGPNSDAGASRTMIHEFMHAWHSQRLEGAGALKCFGKSHKPPSNIYSNHCRGFTEGFANAAALAARAELYGAARHRPYTREFLANLSDHFSGVSYDVTNEGEALRTDFGWENFFRFLLVEEEWVGALPDASASACQPSDVGVFELLRALESASFDYRDPVFADVTDALEEQVGGFGARDSEFYLQFADPSLSGREIHDDLCAGRSTGLFHLGQAMAGSDWAQVSAGLAGNERNEVVVILGPPSHSGDDAGVAQLRNVTSNTFQVRFMDWNHLDAVHTPERIPFLALTPGHHSFAGGGTGASSRWEAGTVPLTWKDPGDDPWKEVDFEQTFPGTPRLFLTLQTSRGAHRATVRARSVQDDGFEARLVEQESLNDGHQAEETLGYLAVYSSGSPAGVPIGGDRERFVTARKPVSGKWNDVSPVGSTWTVPGGYEVLLDEETSADSEVGHPKQEDLDLLRLDRKLFAQRVTSNGADPVSLRQRRPAVPVLDSTTVGQSWKSLPLPPHYDAPVVVAGPATHRGPHPGTVRLRGVEGSSFGMRFEEWDYRRREHDDTHHRAEVVPYLVLDEGRYRLEDGTTWEAGSFEIDGNRDWTPVEFGKAFEGEPRLFLTVGTNNGGQTVYAEADAVDEKGFRAALIEEEKQENSHFTETVYYVAVHPGSGPTVQLPLGTGTVPYDFTQVEVDHRGKTVGGSEIFLEEEKSAGDGEEGHVLETVDALTFGDWVIAQVVTKGGSDPVSIRRRP